MSVPESHKPIVNKVARSSVCPLLKSVSICQSTCRIPPALGMGMLQRIVQQAVLNTLENCEDFDEVVEEELIEKCVMGTGQLKTGARQIHQEMHIGDRDLIKDGGILEKVVKGELDCEHSL